SPTEASWLTPCPSRGPGSSGGSPRPGAAPDRPDGADMPLVAAVACAHTPQLLVRPPTEDRALVLRVHAAFARIKARLADARPDAIAVVAGDHIEGFFLDAVPALGVFVGGEVAGQFGQYRYRFPVHEALARGILEAGIERGFDLLYTQ